MAEMMWARSLSDTLRQGLREPVWWAAIASVGLHGAALALAPLLPDSGQESEASVQRPVSLVQLTPDELNRVPEFELPNTSLPPLVPAPSGQTGKSGSYSLTPLPGQSSLPVPNFPSFEQTLPPPPPSTFPSFPIFPNNFPIFGGRSAVRPPAPPPSAIARRPTAPPRPAPESSPAPAPESTSPSLNKPQGGAKTPASPSPETAEAGATPNPGAVAVEPGATPTPAASAPTPLTREQILASLPEDERSLYLPNPVNTKPQEVAVAMGSWFEQARRWLGAIPAGKREDDYVKTLTFEQSTGGTACTLGLSGGASVGVLVRADGKVETDPAPVLLQSAGYEVLNQEALAIAQNFDYERPGHKRIYQMNIKFAPPENCPAAESSRPAS